MQVTVPVSRMRASSLLPNLWRCLAILALLLGLAAQAQAAKVLILTTNQNLEGAGHSDGSDAIQNLTNEFIASAGAANVTSIGLGAAAGLETPNLISQATFQAGPYDVVVVGSAYIGIDNSNWSVLQSAIAGRWASSFVFFVDGCCEGSNGGNVSKMVAAVNGGSLSSFTIGGLYGAFLKSPLNTNSPYSASFTNLNPLLGQATTYLNNVPGNQALYLADYETAANFPPVGSTAPVNNVYGACPNFCVNGSDFN